VGGVATGVLAGGYLPYADVRYYTYTAVTRIAEDAKRAQRAAGGERVSFLGDTKSSLGDAKSSLGDAKS
jgi:hypothetical protein